MRKNVKYEDILRLCEKKTIKRAILCQMAAAIGLLLLFLTMMMWCFYHEAKVVSGQSMQPTINNDFSVIDNHFDVVLVNKTQIIHRQDIIIIDFSEYTEDELIIKRVIATGGDSIKIVWEKPENSDIFKSVVYLKKAGEQNFVALKEDYTKTIARVDENTCAKTFNEGASSGQYKSYVWDKDGYTYNTDGSITIKDGYFFALGDNRENSLDSSEVGPFKIDKVEGIADFVFREGTWMNKLLRKLFHLQLGTNND